MKNAHVYLFLSVCLLCSCSESRNKNTREISIRIYDVLPENQNLHQLTAKSLSGISKEDLSEICSAVSRTPLVRGDIVSVRLFPTEAAFAARVEVGYNLLLMCKTGDGKWHVIQVINFSRRELNPARQP